jgi:multiple sugar transport system ATP-binding protein
VKIPAEKAAKAKGKDLLIAGIRPEHFEDASVVDSDKATSDATFHAKVDVVEWLGNEAYAYVPFEAPPEVEKQLQQLERDLDGESLRTQLVISLDGASRISEGDDATIWVDARKIHLFDPASGDNLTMDASRAGTVPGGNMMAKAEEVGQEQDEVQPASDEPAS